MDLKQLRIHTVASEPATFSVVIVMVDVGLVPRKNELKRLQSNMVLLDSIHHQRMSNKIGAGNGVADILLVFFCSAKLMGFMM